MPALSHCQHVNRPILPGRACALQISALHQEPLVSINASPHYAHT